MPERKERHILALSGGKDSAALAVYMREKYPELSLEYVFIDSGYELPETHDYINKIRAILNISIITIGGAAPEDGKDFMWWLKAKNNYLPSPKNRWCTEILKILPYNKWIDEHCGGQVVHSYVGLRADEKRERKGNFCNRENFFQHHPFMDDGLIYEDIEDLLKNSGLGFPTYYDWRSRSGCFFCFYQTKREWIGLYDHHKSLFNQASAMEKIGLVSGKKYTWCETLPLSDLVGKRNEILINSKTVVHGKEKSPKLVTLLEDFCCCTTSTNNLSDIIRR